MMSKIKKIMGVLLSLTLVFSMCAVAPASAEVAASTETKLAISSVTSDSKWYHNAQSGTYDKNDGGPLKDNDYGTWVQWEAATSTDGAQLTIELSALSKVSRVEIYVGMALWSNTTRRNSRYSAVPVKITDGYTAAENWSVSEKKTIDETVNLDTPVDAKTAMAAGNTASDLQKIDINVDDILCDTLSLTIKALGGAIGDNGWEQNATSTTRMAVAEIVVYGENLNDVLRDSDGNAICTVETDTPSSGGYYEDYMLDEDTATRWRIAGVKQNNTAELIFRLDGVYNIAGFRACEYWQAGYQTDSTFKNVDLYVGNTTGAVTNWEPIATGLEFNSGTTGGKSVENYISGSSKVGDSFKMVIRGSEYTVPEKPEGATAVVTYHHFLTDVNIYGERVGDLESGSTMQYCEFKSDETEGKLIKSADTVTLTPTFSGTQPSTVAIAAYGEDGKLVGAAFGAANEEITMDNISGAISYIKIFGWSSTDSLVPVSTTFSRHAVTQ